MLALRSRVDYGDVSGAELWTVPKEQRGPVCAPVQEDGEREADRGSGLQQVAESTEDAVPVQEQDVSTVCSEVHVLNGVVAELTIKDDEVSVVSGDGGRCGSFQQSASVCGVAPVGADGGDGLMCSSRLDSYVCRDARHHRDNTTGNPPGAEAARSLVEHADKEVQCDMFSAHWADDIHRQAMLRIEALERKLNYYEKMGK